MRALDSSFMSERALRWSAFAYGIGLVIHTGDHFRRTTSAVSTQILILGAISTFLAVFTFALIARRSERAPLVAAVVGIMTAIGVSAVHLLPQWSTSFSDAFPGGGARDITALSWTAVVIEIAGALAMGLAGLTILRAPGTPD